MVACRVPLVPEVDYADAERVACAFLVPVVSVPALTSAARALARVTDGGGPRESAHVADLARQIAAMSGLVPRTAH